MGDLASCPRQQFILRLSKRRRRQDSIHCLIDWLAAKDDPADPALHQVPEVSKHYQRKTQRDEQQAGQEHVRSHRLRKPETLVQNQQHRDVRNGKGGIRNKADKGIEQQESIVLQQNNQSNGNADMVPGNLSGPGRPNVPVTKMNERSGEEQQARESEPVGTLPWSP